MPKPPNILETETIKVSSNRLIEHYLEKAVETGLYGKNPTEAAGILLSRAIEQLIENDIIDRAPKSVQTSAKKR